MTSTPEYLFYEMLSISKDEKSKTVTINTSLIAYREESIVSFITNLMVNPSIDQVNINKIEKKEKENQYSISLTLLFKSAQTASKT